MRLGAGLSRTQCLLFALRGLIYAEWWPVGGSQPVRHGALRGVPIVADAWLREA